VEAEPRESDVVPELLVRRRRIAGSVGHSGFSALGKIKLPLGWSSKTK
jgi:hypothetical protein